MSFLRLALYVSQRRIGKERASNPLHRLYVHVFEIISRITGQAMSLTGITHNLLEQVYSTAHVCYL